MPPYVPSSPSQLRLTAWLGLTFLGLVAVACGWRLMRSEETYAEGAPALPENDGARSPGLNELTAHAVSGVVASDSRGLKHRLKVQIESRRQFFNGLSLDERLADPAGVLNIGETRTGFVFVQRPGHQSQAIFLSVGAFRHEDALAVSLTPVRGRVEVELPAHLIGALVGLRFACHHVTQSVKSGRVTFEHVPMGLHGSVSLESAAGERFVDSASSVFISEGSPVERVRLGWEPAAWAIVTVVDERGIPQTGEVNIDPIVAEGAVDDGHRWPQRGEAEGESPFQVNGLSGSMSPGPATLSVSTRRFTTQERIVDLAPGRNEFTVTIPRTAERVAVKGRIRHHAGRGLRSSDQPGDCPGDTVEVHLVENPVGDELADAFGDVDVTNCDGELSGLFDRGRWLVSGWASDGSKIAQVELVVPGPPLDLVLLPPARRSSGQ